MAHSCARRTPRQPHHVLGAAAEVLVLHPRRKEVGGRQDPWLSPSSTTTPCELQAFSQGSSASAYCERLSPWRPAHGPSLPCAHTPQAANSQQVTTGTALGVQTGGRGVSERALAVTILLSTPHATWATAGRSSSNTTPKSPSPTGTPNCLCHTEGVWV